MLFAIAIHKHKIQHGGTIFNWTLKHDLGKNKTSFFKIYYLLDMKLMSTCIDLYCTSSKNLDSLKSTGCSNSKYDMIFCL